MDKQEQSAERDFPLWIRGRHVICPHCLSEDVERSPVELYRGTLYAVWHCLQCNRESRRGASHLAAHVGQ